MDPIKAYTAEEIAALTAEQLTELLTETTAALDAAFADATPTEDVMAAALVHAGNRDLVEARQAEIASTADRFAALKETATAAVEEPEPVEPVEPVQAAVEDDPEPEPVDEPEPEPALAPTALERLAAKQAAQRTTTIVRPQYAPVVITAAAEASGLAAGATVDMEAIGLAVLERAQSFSAPSGDGQSENLQHFGTARFAIQFPEELMVDDMNESAEDAIAIATDESRLPNGSLVAAGGWCAPSETVYDLDQDATTEGMLSLPEIGVRRGGIRYPVRPEFADFYANPGFKQTEAQNIAGGTKTCVTVSCPTFAEVRLDVEGVCIKLDILGEVGYPENVANFVSGTLIAHEHWINADKIARVQTAAGAARVITGLGDTATDLLEGLILVIDQRRQIHRLSMNQAMEVLLPFWVKGMLKADIGRRTGRPAPAVKDAEVTDLFVAANANVQWLYDWQLLVEADETYPASFDAIIYPAGTFVLGTQPVIKLDTIYDAASLAVNTYTGLFTEQAYLVAKKKLGADRVTFPVHNAGRTGKADLTA